MKFIYYLVFFFWYLLSLLPLRVLYFISDVLFVPLFYGLKLPSGYRTPKYSRLISRKDRRRDSENRKRVLSFFLRLCSRNHQVVFDVEKADDEAYDF